MRKIHSKDSDDSFQESVKGVIQVVIIIKQETVSHLNIDHLRSMTSFDFSIFNGLIYYEAFDHPQLLKEFTNKMIDCQANLIMTLDQIEQDYCNGNFHNNPLLKMMLIQFVYGPYREQLYKIKWIKGKDIYSQRSLNFATTLHHIYLKDEERGDEIDQVECLSAPYTSHFTIKFFIANNLGFKMLGSSELVDFLKKLEYIGGLPKEISIDRIIKLYIKDQRVLKWDKATFVNYLTEEKEEYDPSKERGISPEEYQRFMKLVE